MMMMRHLLSIAALPFMVTIVIPVWLAARNNVHFAIGASLLETLAQIVGMILLSTGVFLFSSSLRRFATEGQGTLAPWDTPRRLVLHGPYRYVRNPMISGVILVLFGEALVLLSKPHLEWALIFLIAN